MNKKYRHTEHLHNLKDPEIIIPILQEYVNPKSVVDVGCGLATFLKVYKDKYQVEEILGIDGKWVDKELLSKNIDPKYFLEVDLELGFNLQKRFDLAICIEVVEHLKPESSDLIVDSLINLSDVILFSAAIPFQSGDNHKNEQWPGYWQSKFEERGYAFYDCIRPHIWDNKELFWWYKQNIFLIIKKDNLISKTLEPCRSIINVVHPDLLEAKYMEIETFNKGKRGPLFYFGLLLKSIFNKLH